MRSSSSLGHRWERPVWWWTWAGRVGRVVRAVAVGRHVDEVDDDVDVRSTVSATWS